VKKRRRTRVENPLSDGAKQRFPVSAAAVIGVRAERGHFRIAIGREALASHGDETRAVANTDEIAHRMRARPKRARFGERRKREHFAGVGLAERHDGVRGPPRRKFLQRHLDASELRRVDIARRSGWRDFEQRDIRVARNQRGKCQHGDLRIVGRRSKRADITGKGARVIAAAGEVCLPGRQRTPNRLVEGVGHASSRGLR
jgi:hypothetical protein